jgi:hypothetical protein
VLAKGIAVDRTENASDERIAMRRLPLAWAVAVIAAFSFDAAIYLVADAIGAIPDDLPEVAAGLGIPSIAVVVVLTLTVAAIALALFARSSQQPVRNFTILSGIVFATSLQPVIGMEGATVSLRVTLVIMHAVTALITWWVMTRLSRIS